MMTHGYDRPLYVLPFDHRGSFETGMFGWKCANSGARRVRQMIEQIKSGCDVEVDGGIDAKAAPLALAAGANVLVAGTTIFAESEGVAAAMDRLRASIKQSWKQP